MSHTTTVETSFLDHGILEAVCRSLGLECNRNAQAKLFQPKIYNGTVIKLPGWKYPVIIEADGTARFDNYNGDWGNIEELNKLKQEYATEVTRRKLRSMGHQFREVRENGKVKIVVRTRS